MKLKMTFEVLPLKKYGLTGHSLYDTVHSVAVETLE